MASTKASDFSIDHIMGFTSKEAKASTSTAKDNVSPRTHSVGDHCFRPETYCNRYTVYQPLAAHPHWETSYHSMVYDYSRNDLFGCAPFNYYPYVTEGSFQNGAGSQYAGLYLPTVTNPRKRSRTRTVFTETQAQDLELLFGVTEHPAAEAREELAAKAGLSSETVRVWFKNRRARRRRQAVVRGRTSARAKGVKQDSPESNSEVGIAWK